MDISGAVILPTMHTLGLYFKELFNVFAYVNGKKIGWNTSQTMTQNISYWYYPREKKKQTTCNAIIRLLLRRHILNYEAKMAHEDEKDIHITNNQEKQMKTTVQHQFANV